MSRIVSVGPVCQEIFLIDHDDLTPTKIGSEAIFGKVLVGSETIIDNLVYSVGGSAFNAATMFARHNHESILISNIAEDSAGEAVLSALDQEGIDNSYINFIPNSTTDTTIILLDSKTGARTRLAYLSAAKTYQNLQPSDLETANPSWLYMTSLNGDYETIAKIFAQAKKQEAKICFVPGKQEFSDPKKLLKLASMTDILILNKTEAAKLVPGKILSEQLYHLQNYAKVVIITAGAMGGIATNQEETYRFGIYEDVPVRDHTGAGDAFAAGFLSAFSAGMTFKNSLIFASANATKIISTIGANRHYLPAKTPLHPMPIQKL